jgi:hypothetical protein
MIAHGIGFIKACSHPRAVEVDSSCKGIGGRITAATITPANGFQWIEGYDPIPSPVTASQFQAGIVVWQVYNYPTESIDVYEKLRDAGAKLVGPDADQSVRDRKPAQICSKVFRISRSTREVSNQQNPI